MLRLAAISSQPVGKDKKLTIDKLSSTNHPSWPASRVLGEYLGEVLCSDQSSGFQLGHLPALASPSFGLAPLDALGLPSLKGKLQKLEK